MLSPSTIAPHPIMNPSTQAEGNCAHVIERAFDISAGAVEGRYSTALESYVRLEWSAAFCIILLCGGEFLFLRGHTWREEEEEQQQQQYGSSVSTCTEVTVLSQKRKENMGSTPARGFLEDQQVPVDLKQILAKDERQPPKCLAKCAFL